MDTPDRTSPLDPGPFDTTTVEPAPLEPGEVPPSGRRRGAVALPVDLTVDRDRRRGLRMRSLVLGLVLLAASGTSLARLLTGARVDDAAVALGVLLAAGALLLGGGIVATVRDTPDGGRRGS